MISQDAVHAITHTHGGQQAHEACQSLLRGAVGFHTQVPPEEEQIRRDCGKQVLELFRESVQAVQMEIGHEQDGVAVEGLRQVRKGQGNLAFADLQRVLAAFFAEPESEAPVMIRL
jgi:hypothetical protein